MDTRPTELPDTLVPAGTAHGAAEEATERDTSPASRYEVLGELARGGMGIVFRARDRLLNREVGIKTLRENPAPAPVLARFRTEAHITGQLQHPSVPPVHELGVLPDGRPFIAMKLIKGQTLDAQLKDRTNLDADRARFVAIFEQIAHGVAYAHARGVVHRDLKPSNVMVGAHGEVHVMDWGLAKVVGQSADRTRADCDTGPATVIGAPDDESDSRAGRAFGTPAYMPVEQAIGALDRVDPRSDVFSLGGILCAILTGKPPYVAATGEAARQMAATAKLSDCRARLRVCGAEPELVALCNWCLQPEPEDRPADADAVARAVSEFRADVERRARQAELDRVRADGARAVAEATAAEAVNTRREAEARADAERAKAREQRARLRVQRALLGALALLFAAGGAFAWWKEKAASERQRLDAERRAAEALATAERGFKVRQAQQGIDAALALADALRKQARFAQAEQALAQARRHVGEGAEDRSAVVERAAADLKFAARTDAIRYQKYARVAGSTSLGQFDVRSAPGKYREVFAERGLDPLARPVAETVALIESEGAAVRDEILAALDDWAHYEQGDEPWARLLALARQLETNEWAKRLREPAARADPNELAMLAANANFAQPALLVVLANLMAKQKLNPCPLLRMARLRHPNSFELAFALGLFATDDEQTTAYEVARALRPDNAIACLNLAIARAERCGAATGFLGRFRHRCAGAAHALELFECAIKLDPRNALVHLNFGLALVQTGDLDAAGRAFTEAAKLDPQSGLASYNLALIEFNRGRYAEAVAHAIVATRAEVGLARAHAVLGVARWRLGDVTGARAALQEAVRLEPKNADWAELLDDLPPDCTAPLCE